MSDYIPSCPGGRIPYCPVAEFGCIEGTLRDEIERLRSLVDELRASHD